MGPDANIARDGAGPAGDADAGGVQDVVATVDDAHDAAVPDAAGWTVESPGVFVAVGYGGRRLRSIDDGQHWIDDQALTGHGGDDDMLLRSVVYGADRFVATGWRAMTSVDGTAWTDDGAHLGQWIGAMVYAQGQYVSIGGWGWRRTSTDGVTWHAYDADSHAACHSHDGLAFGDTMGGRYVMLDDTGARFYASDGHSWQASSGGDATEDEIAFGNGVFVAAGGRHVVRSTDGGATWTMTATLGADVGGLVFAQGRFLAVANGHAYTSTDGVAWADQASDSALGAGLAYGHGTYVRVAGSTLGRSTDGVHWTTTFHITDGANALEWAAFGP